MTQPEVPRLRPRPGPRPGAPDQEGLPIRVTAHPPIDAAPPAIAAPQGDARPRPPNAHRTAMAVLVTIALVLAGLVVWLVIRTDTVGTKRVALPVRFTDYVRADRAADVVHA